MPGSEERWCGRGNNSRAVFSRHSRPERIYLYFPTPGLRGHWPTHSWNSGHKWCSVEMLRRTTLGNKTKLNKFLYHKISMSLQYRFIFIMVHCESSVDAFFFPSLFDQEISPPFLVVQRLAFEELLMGLMTFQSWEKHRKLQTNFVLKSFQDFLMVISKRMAGRTLRFLGFCFFLQILSLGSGSQKLEWLQKRSSLPEGFVPDWPYWSCEKIVWFSAWEH